MQRRSSYRYQAEGKNKYSKLGCTTKKSSTHKERI